MVCYNEMLPVRTFVFNPRLGPQDPTGVVEFLFIFFTEPNLHQAYLNFFALSLFIASFPNFFLFFFFLFAFCSLFSVPILKHVRSNGDKPVFWRLKFVTAPTLAAVFISISVDQRHAIVKIKPDRCLFCIASNISPHP